MIEIHVDPMRNEKLTRTVFNKIKEISPDSSIGWDFSLLYDEEKYGYKEEIISALNELNVQYHIW